MLTPRFFDLYGGSYFENISKIICYIRRFFCACCILINEADKARSFLICVKFFSQKNISQTAPNDFPFHYIEFVGSIQRLNGGEMRCALQARNASKYNRNGLNNIGTRPNEINAKLNIKSSSEGATVELTVMV